MVTIASMVISCPVLIRGGDMDRLLVVKVAGRVEAITANSVKCPVDALIVLFTLSMMKGPWRLLQMVPSQ